MLWVRPAPQAQPGQQAPVCASCIMWSHRQAVQLAQDNSNHRAPFNATHKAWPERLTRAMPDSTMSRQPSRMARQMQHRTSSAVYCRCSCAAGETGGWETAVSHRRCSCGLVGTADEQQRRYQAHGQPQHLHGGPQLAADIRHQAALHPNCQTVQTLPDQAEACTNICSRPAAS